MPSNLTLRLVLTLIPLLSLGQTSPEILRISPTSGPEGSRVEITGKNLQDVSAVLFGASTSVFKSISAEKLVALVPHKTSMSLITVISPAGRASSPFAFAILNDPRVPEEASYKSGYVNSATAPFEYKSVLLWGIAIADTRVPGYESASVEVATTELSCRLDGKEIILNLDTGHIRGGLYRRTPWFGSNEHEPMPLAYDPPNHASILRVGERSDRTWHFWPASPRAAMPAGNLEGCSVKAHVKISPGALLQMGMDYWRSPTIPYGEGNNHEAGASNWYFPSPDWQDATFTDLGGPQF